MDEASAPADEPAPEVEGLLLDMMRSPEGQRLIARVMQQSGELRSGPGGSTSAEVMAYTERMLGDPATKAALLLQLESRLVQMAGGSSDDDEGEVK